MSAPIFVVRISPTSWLSPWAGEDATTSTTARRFVSKRKAENALAAARQNRRLPDAVVEPLILETP